MRFRRAHLLCVLLGVACASTQDGSFEPERRPDLDPLHALGILESSAGPEGFSMASPRLYRGGQPSARHLALLRTLGVTRIIDLRREALGVRRQERADARALGMEVVGYPFLGMFGADPAFVHGVLEELAADDGGAIYVHCHDGRGRTGLVVALHRVVNEGWSPDLAWEREVLAHGHRPSLFAREIHLTFLDHVREHQARTEATRGAASRRKAVAAARDAHEGEGGPGARTHSRRAPHR